MLDTNMLSYMLRAMFVAIWIAPLNSVRQEGLEASLIPFVLPALHSLLVFYPPPTHTHTTVCGMCGESEDIQQRQRYQDNALP
jgi:hypothetical protein